MILGIESSCDDTAAALLGGDGRILTSVVSSQLAAHRPWGGVVPEIASREHLGNWPDVVGVLQEETGTELEDVGLVAATRGPGLVGSLLVGLSLGKALAYALQRPFYAVHHLAGHLFSPFLSVDGDPADPRPSEFVGLVVSGGHTNLFRVRETEVETLAETRDDAMGEVFDKVGKRLGLPYPQGPVVDRLAETGDPGGFDLPVPRSGDPPFFSYSGLKSATLRELEMLEREGLTWDPDDPPPVLRDLLASFRAAAVDQLLDRVDALHRSRPIGCLAVSGGVAANRELRRRLDGWAHERGVDLRLVAPALSGDNAAMIAFAALLRRLRGDAPDPWSVEALSRVGL
ncbi:MAG: tRNA (adenosine(37)-N6)-threonylcarbamoyltransferase complex transferase subunit TsaD [Thermoanaerobaculia bacterium]|nr:tRNA (adenosine(37)-N6)-threonylcarbamoyltransferase complex transferase subunit TsaD [Thermoanaerobaculia bacterium]